MKSTVPHAALEKIVEVNLGDYGLDGQRHWLLHRSSLPYSFPPTTYRNLSQLNLSALP